MSKREQQTRRRRKKKFRPAVFFTSILYIVIFLGITGPLILLYGPFDMTRKTLISTVLSTRHRYLLTDLFTQEQLNKMMGVTSGHNNSSNNVDQDLSSVDVKYKTGNNITRYDINTNQFNAYVLEISNSLKVRVAMTKYLGKIGEKTSQMAQERDAVAAINGGMFNDYSSDGTQYGGTGAEPAGFVISDGKIIYPKNVTEEVLNKVENVTAIDYSGKLIVGNHSLAELQKRDVKIKEAMCFTCPSVIKGPLIVNGQGQIKQNDSLGQNPRTAIGQKKDGTIVFIVTDGRKVSKPGARIYDVQEILLERGVVNAGMLDGGYSSAMYYNGEVLNDINAWDGERTVATAYYVEE